ncbi:MAG: 30S ribosomal protein S18 [Candidatus Levybacteria bacterium CG_4_10_14_0_2_um_filter_36_16]|nr:MAG: 30S ribosomal protein S18 [Candidatus Levybacteria bacterium CG2_30_37_29]PIR79516.1 MAG: 30S ribosomal protein S18 [Candidatus Levybacteria bacterium CG10_big_fil_rev_8_21_14_0_10_36_30]PIZ97958.1 MAG: 30S ribosomal protein S18 [Candidatus Levybacteria bacterium CG_4_10_14_0_2_um_filter_36_16]
MKKKDVKTARKSRIKEAPKACFFCKEKKEPSFLTSEVLSRFTSERGKIHPRSKSGACAKHQRRVTIEIKRARYLALLPFVVRPD